MGGQVRQLGAEYTFAAQSIRSLREVLTASSFHTSSKAEYTFTVVKYLRTFCLNGKSISLRLKLRPTDTFTPKNYVKYFRLRPSEVFRP